MTIIQDMLAKYDYRNALKEIIQEVALCGMSHSEPGMAAGAFYKIAPLTRGNVSHLPNRL